MLIWGLYGVQGLGYRGCNQGTDSDQNRALHCPPFTLQKGRVLGAQYLPIETVKTFIGALMAESS